MAAMPLKRPLIIAHRGASDECPENTLGAIQRAIDLQADGIEIDIQMTQDRRLAVFHDNKLGRTSPGNQKISDIDSKTLFSLPAGPGEKIPSLQDVLHLKRPPFLMIEIKTTIWHAEEIAHLVHEEVGRSPRIILASFCSKALTTLRRLKSPHPLFAIAETAQQLDSFDDVDGYALHHKWHKEKISEELYKNSTLFYWTVDAITLAHKLVCHGLITNKPRTLQKALSPLERVPQSWQKALLPH